MDRYKQGGEPLLLNPLPVCGAQVGEGQVGAVKKTQPVVVILEIEAAAPPRRLLVDEAERAVVIALLEAIEEGLGETQAQPVIEILLQLHPVQGAVGVFDLQGEFLFSHQHLQINQIAGAPAIDAEQAIAGLEAELLGDGAGLHRGHHGGGGQPGGFALQGG